MLPGSAPGSIAYVIPALSTPAVPIRRAVPPRVRWAAHGVALCAVPSGLWRVALALGVPVGYSATELDRLFGIPGWGTVYVLGLSLLQEALALLTLGLVSGWGERVPGRVPVVGGRPVPARGVVVVAGTGAVLVTLLTLSQAVLWPGAPHGGISDAGRTVLGWCYLPLLAWGPLLGYVTLAYARRRGVLRR